MPLLVTVARPPLSDPLVIDFESTLPSAVEELVWQRQERQRV